MRAITKDGLIEALARGMCRAVRVDPDYISAIDGQPWWHMYVEMAEGAEEARSRYVSTHDERKREPEPCPDSPEQILAKGYALGFEAGRAALQPQPGTGETR